MCIVACSPKVIHNPEYVVVSNWFVVTTNLDDYHFLDCDTFPEYVVVSLINLLLLQSIIIPSQDISHLL